MATQTWTSNGFCADCDAATTIYSVRYVRRDRAGQTIKELITASCGAGHQRFVPVTVDERVAG